MTAQNQLISPKPLAIKNKTPRLGGETIAIATGQMLSGNKMMTISDKLSSYHISSVLQVMPGAEFMAAGTKPKNAPNSNVFATKKQFQGQGVQTQLLKSPHSNRARTTAVNRSQMQRRSRSGHGSSLAKSKLMV